MATTVPMSKPPLLQRPSTLFFSHYQPSKNDEMLMEKRVVNSNFKLRFVLHGFEDCKQYLWNRKYHNITSFEEINTKLMEKIVNPFYRHTEDERIVMGNKLARIGIVEVMANFYKAIQEGADIPTLTDTMLTDDEDDGCIRCLVILRRIMWDFSDCSPNFAFALSKTVFVASILTDIQANCDDGTDKLEERFDAGENLFVFCSAMYILYNIGKHPHAERDVLRQDGRIYKLKIFLNSKQTNIQLMSLLALAYVVKENQMNIFDAYFDVYDYLFACINDAIMSKDRRELDYHIAELVDAVTGLTQSNACKQRLMNKRPLTLIKNLLVAQSLLENLSAMKLVWELAFLEENRKVLKNDEELMNILQELKLNHDPDIRNAAQKTRFVIQWKECCYRDIPVKDEQSEEHILLSYHSADRATVNEIYRALKSEGLPVWIDVAEMNKYADIIDGLKRAVHHSKIVLVCYSEKYKRDQNCRTEAEFAYELRRPIIPIKLRRGYEPDGWLRVLLGSKFYLDFTNHSVFDRQMDKVRDCIRRYEKNVGTMPQIGTGTPRSTVSRAASRAMSRTASRPVSTLPSSRASALFPVYDRKVPDWTPDDVVQWASQFKLQGRAWRIASRLTIQQILHVYSMWKKWLERFIHNLWTFTDYISGIIKFTRIGGLEIAWI